MILFKDVEIVEETLPLLVLFVYLYVSDSSQFMNDIVNPVDLLTTLTRKVIRQRTHDGGLHLFFGLNDIRVYYEHHFLAHDAVGGNIFDGSAIYQRADVDVQCDN